jgi:hypothetical protein
MPSVRVPARSRAKRLKASMRAEAPEAGDGETVLRKASLLYALAGSVASRIGGAARDPLRCPEC